MHEIFLTFLSHLKKLITQIATIWLQRHHLTVISSDANVLTLLFKSHSSMLVGMFVCITVICFMLCFAR